MASEAAQAENGIPNGEDASAPVPPSSEGRRSSQPDNPDPEDKDTGKQSVQGTQEKDSPAPDEKEATPAEEKDPLLDYEYYENLDALEKSGADNAKSEDGQGDSVPGTPHDDDRDLVENNKPSNSLGSKESSDEQDSNQISDGAEPKDRADPSHREVDEASEGTATTNPTTTLPNTKGASSEVSDIKEDGAGERPVRHQLKKTSIAEGAEALDSMASSQDSLEGKSCRPSESSDNEGRGRARKRSLDDLEQEHDDVEATKSKEDDGDGHRRKRSRDMNDQPDDSKSERNPEEEPAEEEAAKNAGAETASQATTGTTSTEEKSEDPSDKIRSPKKKRSRDQFDADRLKTFDHTETPKDAATECAEGEPEKKRHRDRSHERSSESKDGGGPTKVGIHTRPVCFLQALLLTTHFSILGFCPQTVFRPLRSVTLFVPSSFEVRLRIRQRRGWERQGGGVELSFCLFGSVSFCRHRKVALWRNRKRRVRFQIHRCSIFRRERERLSAQRLRQVRLWSSSSQPVRFRDDWRRVR